MLLFLVKSNKVTVKSATVCDHSKGWVLKRGLFSLYPHF